MGERYRCLKFEWVVPLACAILSIWAPEAYAQTPLRLMAEARQATPAESDPVDMQRYFDPISENARKAQGLYITGPFVRHFGVRGVVKAIRRSHLNAAVIDLKDDKGRVTYVTKVPMFRKQQKNLLGDVAKLVRHLKKEGIHTIARVVCFNDDQLAAQHPELAVQDSRPNRSLWVSWGTGTRWLDPYNHKNHDILLELIKEAQSFGFDEVQLDYIRFPVDGGARLAVFPARVSTLRRYVLRDFLRRVDEALRIPLGVDVFGLTAFHEGDRAGLGQALEEWSPYVEVFSPMLYLNNMKSWGRRLGKEAGVEDARAMRLIYAGVSALRERLGPNSLIRPFLQAFKVGSDYYDGRFIREQIEGAYQGGAQGFYFWHPGSSYGMVQRSLSRGGNPFRRSTGQDGEPALHASRAP